MNSLSIPQLALFLVPNALNTYMYHSHPPQLAVIIHYSPSIYDSISTEQYQLETSCGTPLHAYDKAANRDMYDIQNIKPNAGLEKKQIFGHLSPVQKST